LDYPPNHYKGSQRERENPASDRSSSGSEASPSETSKTFGDGRNTFEMDEAVVK
jgi:hypothetical protein